MANRTKAPCDRCGRVMQWRGKGDKVCANCLGGMANSVTDYARLAEIAVVTMGYPRENWKADGIEHKVVNMILHAWRKDREGNDPALCRECAKNPAGPNGGVCGPCKRRRNNEQRREEMRAAARAAGAEAEREAA